jgi:hypothetical protein
MDADKAAQHLADTFGVSKDEVLSYVKSGHLLSFLAGGLYRIGRCAAGQQYDSTQ